MRTKIIATLGPASSSPDILPKLVNAGARILRLNFSHGSPEEFQEIVRRIRLLEEKLGYPLTVMQDLAGPKIRIGTLPPDQPPLVFTPGDQALLACKKPERALDIPFIPFDHRDVLDSLEEGDKLILADGSLEFEVGIKAPGGFIIKALTGGMVTSRKGLALPGKSVKVAALTDKDKEDLQAGLAMGVDAVALSYVQTPEDILEAKELIKKGGRDIPVVAKLERQNAVDRLYDILKVADIIMVARGDLGVECPLPKLPAMQKRIIKACNLAAKPVIVATQMLLSMVSNNIPTRAETTDVANAVLDGTDCVMLSEETAVGRYPVETVDFMGRIATEAEKLLIEERLEVPVCETDAQDFLSYSACLLAEKRAAKGIVTHSVSGSSGRSVASHRPGQPVFVLTPGQTSLRHLNFSWGVTPVLTNVEISGHLERAQHFIDESPRFREGDDVVITAGQVKGAQDRTQTNLVKIYRK